MYIQHTALKAYTRKEERYQISDISCLSWEI